MSISSSAVTPTPSITPTATYSPPSTVSPHSSLLDSSRSNLEGIDEPSRDKTDCGVVLREIKDELILVNPKSNETWDPEIILGTPENASPSGGVEGKKHTHDASGDVSSSSAYTSSSESLIEVLAATEPFLIDRRITERQKAIPVVQEEQSARKSAAKKRSDFGSLEEIKDEFNSISDEDVTSSHSDDDDDGMEREKIKLLHDKWRELFDKYDEEGFGEILWSDFAKVVRDPAFIDVVTESKVRQLERKAKMSNTSAITFQDFVNVMTGKRARSFRCAVHERDKQVSSENDFHVLFKKPPLFDRMVRLIADEFLTDERDRKYYADHYRCWPPPFFIILVTLLQLAIFCYYTVVTAEMDWGGPVPLDSPFIYRPDKRHHVWRFVFYAFLHAGWVHLAFNLMVQLLIGLPLEMVHGSIRIGIVYLAGVLAGSLGTSVFDSEVYLVGASGGVYALLAAHLSNVLINYNNMQFGVLRLVGVLFIASADVGYAIYDRYAHVTMNLPVSYVAHLTGALAGLTLGLVVLKNFEQRLHEQLLWWVALGVAAACLLFALLFNVFHPYPYQGVGQGQGLLLS